MSFSAASVPIGGYSLEVGTQANSFARFEPEEERDNAQELAAALDEEPEAHSAVDAIEEFEASADEVTGRIEHAEGLLRAAAEGKLLDPDKLTGEVDSLLELFGRLDKSGRFDEELRLMRSLNGLLALSLRWLELVRSLRSLLRSADSPGREAGKAFARHELGSLHLCAGQAQKAREHLEEALRIEEQLRDLSGRCSTRHNLDAAQRELAARRIRPPHRLLRLALLAALFVGLGAGGTSIAFGIGGGGGGTTASAAFRVEQDFEPDNPRASTSVSVSCTEGGAPDAGPKPASEAAPAVFAISGFDAGATCTATVRRRPTGYTTDVSDCRNVPITDDGSSCTITSTRRKAGSATFSVTKDFQPGNEAAVSVSVSCTKGGRPDASPKRAREGAPAVFTIKGFRPGATCTATERAAPAGYTKSERGCQNVPIARGKAAACTIINTRETPSSITFAVAKDFDPDAAEASVTISVSCTDGGTPDASTKPASEGTPAVFRITGFGPGATCTATEGSAPDGYTSDESDCTSAAIATKRSCTITNTLNSATFSVGREFDDGNTNAVAVSLTCDSGTVEPPRGTAREGSPAAFTVTGFTAGATCNATTVKAPSGYRRNETACQDVPLDARGCTIFYTTPG